MAESALIDDLLRQYGENPRRVFARLANEYRKQGDLTTAIEICRTQVPLQPTYISGYIVLGQALFESGQLDEARATFEAAIGLDPENLIALRQLGDIARMGGDLDGARGWYYRLLEVDPANEEVVAHVRSLEAAPPPPSDSTTGEHVSWSDINPERPTTPQPVVPLPRLTLGVIPEDLTAEPARAPEPAEMSATDAGPPPSAPSTPTPTVTSSSATQLMDLRPTPPSALPNTIERPALAKSPPPVEAAPAAPIAASAPPAPAPEPAPRVSGLEITGLEEFAQFTQPIAPPPPPTTVPSAPPPATTSELPPLEAMTGEFGAPPAPPAPVASSAEPATPTPEFRAPTHQPEEEEPALWSPPPTTQEMIAQSPPAANALRDTLSFPTPKNVKAVEDLIAAPVATPAPADAAPRAPDKRASVDNWGSIDTPPPPPAPSKLREEPYDPTVGRMLDLGTSSAGEVPSAFMTETMAELYLQQGYSHEALQIYRQLSAMRPDDASLKERIARLERGSRSSLSEVAAVSEDVITAARARASKTPQTSRSFFGGLASRRAPNTPPRSAPVTPPSPSTREPAPVAQVAAPPAPPVPEIPIAPARVVPPAPPPPTVMTPASAPPPSVASAPAPAPVAADEAAFTPRASSEISKLFTDRVAAADEMAANALASAFVEQTTSGTPTPAAAQPSRAASQPLSLDEVFRGQRPTTDAQRASPNVTFDEFFAPRDSGAMAAVDPSSPVRPAAGAPPEADLALFHEWLDGLKK